MLPPLSLDDLLVNCQGRMTPALKQTVLQQLQSCRAVVLRNTGMTKAATMADWAAFLDLEQMDYRYGTGFRSPMGGGVLSVGTEPHYTHVDPHSEMAYWSFYPKQILFGCETIPANGGDTVIADNCAVTRDLQGTDVERKILTKGIRYIRNFSHRDKSDSIVSTKTWQENFNIDSIDQLVQYCDEMQWNLQCRDDGSVQVSYSEEGYEYDLVSDMNVFFTSMARLGRAFDNWPPYNTLPCVQRPYHLTYADGEEFSKRDLDTLDHAFSKYSVPIKWQPGDIAILENIAWTHARPTFELGEGETRSIGVMVCNPIDRKRIVN